MQSLAEIRQRHYQGKRWRCAEDIGDLLKLLDEAVGYIVELLPSAESCNRTRDTICQAGGGCDACDVAQAREFVERLRGEAL